VGTVECCFAGSRVGLREDTRADMSDWMKKKETKVVFLAVNSAIEQRMDRGKTSGMACEVM
jgi:hypothetical protein